MIAPGADDFVTLSLENTAYANNTPSPGPGNGCLNIKSSSIPNSKPIFLTSSLNNSLKGSTIWNSISSGIPPTL